MKINKESGFTHDIVMVLVVVAVAILGTYFLVASHADPLTPKYTNGSIYTGQVSINSEGNGFSVFVAPSGYQASYSNVSFNNGSQVAYFTSITGPAPLYVGSLSGNNVLNPIPISILPTGASANGPPLWSPNDEWLAVNSNKGVWLAKADGSGSHWLKNFSPSLYYGLFIGWLPNSSALAYTIGSSSGIATKLCTININGTDSKCNSIKIGTVIVGGTLGSGGLSVSPNGKNVLLVAYNYPTQTLGPSADIYKVGIDGTGLTKLTDYASGQQVQSVVWSPDATKIAYILDAGGSSTTGLYFMEANGSNQTELNTTNGGISNVVSPDSLSWAHQ